MWFWVSLCVILGQRLIHFNLLYIGQEATQAFKSAASD